jgi:hypothetical protein
MARRLKLGFCLIALASCGPQKPPRQPPSNSTAPSLPERGRLPSPEKNAVARQIQAPPGKTSLAEPKGPIDPKSIEAAGQVVQQYGALIEQKRFLEAAKLWSEPTVARDFAEELGDRQIHMEIGELGQTEGAAGSIYTNVPVVFYAGGLRRTADVTLRRVNDVPGSSEAQRRWHIERIQWGKSG